MLDTGTFFDWIFNHANNNAILIMDANGIIVKANRAFTTCFGYTEEEMSGRFFSFLFTEEDKKIRKPQTEIDVCNSQGAANDNNYIVHKEGYKIWVTGEAVKVIDDAGTIYIVKIIHTMHSQKLLEKYLQESNEFLDAIFESIKDMGMVIIDSRMKILKHNRKFNSLFLLGNESVESKRLMDFNMPLGKDPEVQNVLRNIFIKGTRENIKRLELIDDHGNTTYVDTKIKMIDFDSERKLLMVFSPAEKPQDI